MGTRIEMNRAQMPSGVELAWQPLERLVAFADSRLPLNIVHPEQPFAMHPYCEEVGLRYICRRLPSAVAVMIRSVWRKLSRGDLKRQALKTSQVRTTGISESVVVLHSQLRPGVSGGWSTGPLIVELLCGD